MQTTVQQTPRRISLTELCDIAADVISHTAPAAESIGKKIEQLDHPIAQQIGDGLKDTARFFLNLLPLLQQEGIQVVDYNGSRSVKTDQTPVIRALKAIRQRAQ